MTGIDVGADNGRVDGYGQRTVRMKRERRGRMVWKVQ